MRKIIVTLFLTISFAPQVIPMEPTQEMLDKSLIVAAKKGNVQRIKEWLDAGANIEARWDSWGLTPLMISVMYGQEDVCEFFLDNGANLHARDSKQNTVLTTGFIPTVEADTRIRLIKVLLNHGSDVNAQNEAGGSALFYAGQRHPAVCAFLMQNGANPTLRFKRTEETPLIHSAQFYTVPKTYIIILQTQYQINRAMEVTLLCLNRIKRDMTQPKKIRICAGELYRQFNTLLKPHMGNYIPLKQLLNMQDTQGKRAYDYLQNEYLNPDTVYEALDALEKSRNGWFSNCSIQ